MYHFLKLRMIKNIDFDRGSPWISHCFLCTEKIREFYRGFPGFPIDMCIKEKHRF